MKNSTWFALWGGLFILCAGLGFVPAPQGAAKWLLVALAAAFFVPPVVIARRAVREKDRMTLRLLRNLSIASLVLTVVVLIGNFMTVMAPEAVGNAMYIVLVVVSAPMVCGQYWLLSLFLWAFLMTYCVSRLMRKKRN